MHLIIDSSVAKGSEMMLSNALVGWRQMCWFARPTRDRAPVKLKESTPLSKDQTTATHFS